MNVHISYIRLLIICNEWSGFLVPKQTGPSQVNHLNAELNPICYLLALLAHHFLHVSRIRVKTHGPFSGKITCSRKTNSNFPANVGFLCDKSHRTEGSDKTDTCRSRHFFLKLVGGRRSTYEISSNQSSSIQPINSIQRNCPSFMTILHLATDS